MQHARECGASCIFGGGGGDKLTSSVIQQGSSLSGGEGEGQVLSLVSLILPLPCSLSLESGFGPLSSPVGEGKASKDQFFVKSTFKSMRESA